MGFFMKFPMMYRIRQKFEDTNVENIAAAVDAELRKLNLTSIKTGQRVAITGGSRGIGKAVARELAREGVDVGDVGREEVGREASEMKRELARAGGDLEHSAGDRFLASHQANREFAVGSSRLDVGPNRRLSSGGDAN